MHRIVYQFIAGFCIALILMLALCGFVVVDLSAERYMPGRFDPLLTISAVDAGGMELSLMGERYRVEPLLPADSTWALGAHSLLPFQWQMASGAGRYLFQYLQGDAEPVEEP